MATPPPPPAVSTDLLPIFPLDRADVVGRKSRDEGYEALTYDIHYVMERTGKEVRWTDKPSSANDVCLSVPLASYANSPVRNLLKILPLHSIGVFITPVSPPVFTEEFVTLTLSRVSGHVAAADLLAAITQEAIGRGVPFLAMPDVISDWRDDCPELAALKPEFEFRAEDAGGQTPVALLEQFLLNTDAKKVVLTWKLAVSDKNEALIQVWQVYFDKPPKADKMDCKATASPATAPPPSTPLPARPAAPPAAAAPPTPTVEVIFNLKKRRQESK